MLNKHDRLVRKIANSYDRRSWKVAADLPGYRFPEPPRIRGEKPDVFATKREEKRIIEVERNIKSLYDNGLKQLEAFSKESGAKVYLVMCEQKDRDKAKEIVNAIIFRRGDKTNK